MPQRNILIFTFAAIVTASFFQAASYAQLSKTKVSGEVIQIPPTINSDTPAVVTEITNNGFTWRIYSDHYPLQVGDRMIIRMFKGVIPIDSCKWGKQCGGYDCSEIWTGKALIFDSINSDDGGYYELQDTNSYFDNDYGYAISKIKLHVFSAPFSQEFSDACEAPELNFFARDKNIWSVKKNINKDRTDVIEIDAIPSTLAPVLFTSLEGPGTLSFTLGNDSIPGNLMSCVFRIIDSQNSDTILTYKIDYWEYEINKYKQYTFNLDYRKYTIEWQRMHPVNSKGGYKPLQLDSIIFTPGQIVTTSPFKNQKDKIILQQNTINSTCYDISGRTIQNSTNNRPRSHVSPRLFLKSKQKH